MPQYLQVKIAGANDPRGPSGWPVDNTEPVQAAQAPALQAGYDAVWTASQFVSTKTSLQATYDAWLAARTADPVATRKTAILDAADRDFLQPIFRALLSHENRIRALEGKAAITAAQFRAALISLMD